MTQIIMRSNNALLLLPFNLFEFSMVSEVIAAELRVEIGETLHYAASMHIYEDKVQNCLARLALPALPVGQPMDAMPRDPGPLVELKTLIRFESDMRHGSCGIESDTVAEWLGRASDTLTPYWRQFAFLLLWAAVARRGDDNALAKVEQSLKPVFRAFLPKSKPISGARPRPRAPELMDGLFASRQDESVILPHRPGLEAIIRMKAEAYEKFGGERIGAAVMLDVRAGLIDRLAARGNEEILSDEDFAEAVRTVKERGGP